MNDNICTKEKPYKNGAKGRWQHLAAIEVGEYDLDYSTFVKYKCPHCGLAFTCELPN